MTQLPQRRRRPGDVREDAREAVQRERIVQEGAVED